MKNFLNHLKKLDWILIVSAILLVIIGLISIYSSSLGKDDFSNFKKQIAFFVVAIFAMFALTFLDWRIFRENSYLILIIYFISLALLIGLFFFAPEIRGVKSWYKLGPFSIDHIELTKIILIILLSKYFATRHLEIYRIRHILLSGLYVLLPSILIFRQPDLGSTLILIALWVGILLISGIKLRHFLILALCGILIFILSWGFLLKDYQKDRIMSYLAPTDPLGVSWSQNQAKIAIGSGGLFGQGIGAGSQTQYGFLPESQTDFIFSAIAEETGIVGVSILLLLFSLVLWRIMRIAINSRENFSRFFVVGFSIVLISQLFIHIGMNIGLLPIIGISLPFISYGGSNLVATFVGLGILQSMKAN